MSAINIYLNIDGVLLANDRQSALYAHEFLDYLLAEYKDQVYWLSTHSRGDAALPIQNVGHLFEPKTIALMEQVKPTNWKTLKTEAINFTEPFLWFDDDLFDAEKRKLREYGVLENWIEIDLAKDNEQLGALLADFPLPVNYIPPVKKKSSYISKAY